ncbi:MAG: NUDIX domain-containing protein [Candidatus Izemoplasmatales bacterium]|jgi:ADP-ribose pyrophosphatase YjhB (NUDIX family)|nr:NUDIX domain-containing protein [Candidatus Izemoplasmatales bacterium]MDD3864863.1 NUDIX domain-containing protein [Candidatus Izemoplasmatales bacterium]
MENRDYITFIRSKVGNAKIILNAACAVIVNDKKEILLQKRCDNHKWGLPGGLMELDESIVKTMIREVKEETNLDVEPCDFIGVFINPNMRWRVADEAQVICFSFVAKIISGDLRVNDLESLELRYFGKDELPEIHSIDNVQMIQAYYSGKRNLIEGREYHD